MREENPARLMNIMYGDTLDSSRARQSKIIYLWVMGRCFTPQKKCLMNRMRTRRPLFSEEYNDLKEYDFPFESTTGRSSHLARSFLLGRVWETLISPLQMPAESCGVASVDSIAGLDDVGSVVVVSPDTATSEGALTAPVMASFVVTTGRE